MGCKKYSDWLPLWADCLLSERQQAELEKHLNACPDCHREAELYKRVTECCCHLPRVDVPCDFYDRLSLRLQVECAPPQPKPFIWRLPLMAGGLSAAAVLALLLILAPKPARTPSDALTRFAPRHSQIEKLAPLLNPHPVLAQRPAQAKPASKPAPASAMAALPSAPEPTAASTPAPAVPEEIPQTAAPAEVMAARRGLLQDADFMQSGRFVPAYTVPHAAEETALGGETLPELQPALPARQKPEIRVARSPEELVLLLNATRQKTPLFTELDWNKQMLAAVFFNPGERPGYRLSLDTIEQMPDRIIIHYRLQRPEALVAAPDAADPMLLVVLPRSDLPVGFQEKY